MAFSEFGRRFKAQKETKGNSFSRVHTFVLSNEAMVSSATGNYAPVLDEIRGKLGELGLKEGDLVFRGISHPVGTITAQLLAKYGTDRFKDYGSGKLPSEDKKLIPYKNHGETGLLTADTYATPDLRTSLECTDVELYGTTARSIRFRSGETESFLIAYDSSKIAIKDNPEVGQATFLTKPRKALKAVIHLVPPSEKQ